MSVDGMRGAWGSVEERAQEFRELSEEQLVGGKTIEGFPGDLLAGVLDRLLESSEELRREGDLALRDGEDYESVSTLMLGAAAVDAMLARDAAALDPGIDREELEERFAAEGERIEDLTEDEDLGRLFEEGKQLLDEVGKLFGGEAVLATGRSPGADRATLASESEASIEHLVDLAEPPAADLTRGLVTVAAAGSGELLSAALHMDVVKELERRGERLSEHAPRFLREHVAKIVTLRSADRIVDEMARMAGKEVEERAVRGGAADALLRFVSAPAVAVAHTDQRIFHGPEIAEERGEALLADLADLQMRYGEHMHLIGKSALWLRRGARLLVHLGAVAVGPLSYAIGAGVFFVGLSYVGYSLADRIDARDLGFADRIDGVVRLVDRHVPG